MLFVRKAVIVRAVQFDPHTKPWPTGIKPWDKEETRPRDMSWGWMVVNGNRVHVHAGDWLVYHGDRVWLVERDAFDKLYEVLPGSQEAAANLEKFPATGAKEIEPDFIFRTESGKDMKVFTRK